MKVKLASQSVLGGAMAPSLPHEHDDLNFFEDSMASPRIRRLLLDQQNLTQRFQDWPLIRISETAGMPPEVYRIHYAIKGLYVSAAGEILERDSHMLEVNLTLGYPRRSPQCRMLTSVFHPNFDESSVCIGDFWAASESLDDLIVRIGRMIAYQEYNTKSPLNGLAAKWAAEHVSMLPVDARPIAPSQHHPVADDAPATTTAGVPPETCAAGSPVFCISCGCKNPENAKFCFECGVRCTIPCQR